MRIPSRSALLLCALACCAPERAPSPAATDAASLSDGAARSSEEISAPPPRRKLPPITREGGALARAVGEEALYLADEDHGMLRRIPLPLSANDVADEVPMPGAPAQVLALDGRVLVTIRDPGLLLILGSDPTSNLVEVARVPLPADAWGIAVTPDEKTALVSSAWTHRVSAVDLDDAVVRWTVDVRREPRAIAVRPDGLSAYVTHLVGAPLTRIDGIEAEPRVSTIPFAPAPLRAPVNARAKASELGASLAYAAALSPDGKRLFVPRHALAALGKRSWFGQATVDVLLTESDTSLAPAREHTGMLWLPRDAPQPDITISADGAVPVQVDAPFVQPRALVYRKATNTLLVAGEGDNKVAELDALSLDPSIKPLRVYELAGRFPRVSDAQHGCFAPSGLALSADEATLYVACRTSNALAIVDLDPYPDGVGRATTASITVRLADEILSKTAARGRRLFYDATDFGVSGGLGCAGCHPEGRDDGHVHQEVEHEAGFSLAGGPIRVEGNVATGFPRQTPMLAGRVAARGPYGWQGQSKTLEERLLVGTGMHRWEGIRDSGWAKADDVAAIAAFARQGLVLPPREARPLTEEEKKGQRIFLSERTQCASCHVPVTGYTDREAVQLGHVETRPGFRNEDEDEIRLFKTPSLFYVGGTAPYFHDGRAATLEEVIDKNHDRMGRTDHLSRKDRAALIAFLRTL